MALIIPNSIPAKAGEGEKKLFKILHYELPDEFRIWYEAVVRGRFPDFFDLGIHFWITNIGSKKLVSPARFS